jgi:membrane protease YdiL (CAAX protease family)
MWSVLVVALAFELGLGLLALALGALAGYSPVTHLWGEAGGASRALAFGALAALPPLAGLRVSLRAERGALFRLRQTLEPVVRELFSDFGGGRLAVVSLAAGLGEELLFRGLLLDGLASGGGVAPALALALSSLAFGLAHPLSRLYVLVVTLAGFWLGGLFLLTGSLLAPIVAHALYDFVALRWLLSAPVPPGEAFEPFPSARPDLAPAEAPQRRDDGE